MENNNSNISYAIANIKGSPEYPDITGTIIFKKKNEGVLITSEIFGLPSSDDICDKKIFAMHIHNGNSCTGNDNDPFVNAGTHLNLDNCPHPEHTRRSTSSIWQ